MCHFLKQLETVDTVMLYCSFLIQIYLEIEHKMNDR